MLMVIGCVTQQHDLRLVAVAAVICGLGCFSTVNLLARGQATRGLSCAAWLTSAAAVFGCGIWSLHFIAMIAFRSGLPIAYDVAGTAASIAVAVAGSLLAMTAWRVMPSRGPAVAVSGTVLGLAISLMHYTGVQAMRLPGRVLFDMGQVEASVGLSVAFCLVALARSGNLAATRRRLEVSLWLALAILGLHFTGMSALRIEPGYPATETGAVFGSASLAVAVAAVSLALLVVTLAATLMEQHLALRTVRDFDRMRLLNNLAQEVILIHRGDAVLEVNTAGERLFGLSRATLVGRPFHRLFDGDGLHATLQRMSGPAGRPWPEEMTILTGSGGRIAVEVSSQIIDYDGRAAEAVALLDLTERRRDEARIRHLAHHDALTDLPSRALLQERLSRALDAAARHDDQVAILYLDLDRFKPVNDLLGHAGGDALLVQVARRLLEELRHTDTLARVGGDEFVAVVPHAAPGEAVNGLVKRVIDTIARSFTVEGREVEIGVSVGIAFYPRDGATPETLLRAADTAMYRAKVEGRGAWRYFEPAMVSRQNERNALERDLRSAVDRGEMELFYQPLVACRTGRIQGFEALLRWRHPEQGTLLPGMFIHIAEEIGLIGRLGEWAIARACADAAGWKGSLVVAVNLSPSQLRQPDLPANVAAIIAETGLDPSRLEIEITEDVFIDDASRAVRALSRLRALGVRLSLDDFGTGYSSLSYLRLFSFDKIKIDRSFLRDLEENAEALTILKAMINLGRNLGLAITVEGVETEDQLSLVRAHGGHQVQGFLMGLPAPAGAWSHATRPAVAEMAGTLG